MRYLDHSPKTVALVGMGPSIQDYMTETLTQEFMPDFADEIWTINMASNMVHSDVVFWMDDLDQQDAFKPGLFSVLRRRGIPVITPKHYPEIVPNSYDYPINETAALALPIWGKPYFNNGVAMAIAYAIWKDVKILKLYGCDFSYPNRDYAESGRACCEAWLTFACIKGMTVQICQHTSLFDSVDNKGIYGYREQPEITLPDGSVFAFQRSDPKTYKPEDSSGAKHDNLAANSAGEQSGPAADAGPAAVAGNGLDPTAQAAVARSGESLRDSGQI